MIPLVIKNPLSFLTNSNDRNQEESCPYKFIVYVSCRNQSTVGCQIWYNWNEESTMSKKTYKRLIKRLTNNKYSNILPMPGLFYQEYTYEVCNIHDAILNWVSAVNSKPQGNFLLLSALAGHGLTGSLHRFSLRHDGWRRGAFAVVLWNSFMGQFLLYI